jgi:hypothetical protein
MNRSSFALLTLLAALAAPLALAGAARAQCPGERQICTPPDSRLHPADEIGLTPFPGCLDDYADTCPRSPCDPLTAEFEAAEDWRDYVQSHCEESYLADEPAVVREADADSYSPDAATSDYCPYFDRQLADDDSPADIAGYDSVEAYEAEFSGYGVTDYLEDNFHYQPYGAPLVDPNPVMEFPSESWLQDHAQRLWNDISGSQLVEEARDVVADVRSRIDELTNRHTLATLMEASDTAWAHIDEHLRAQARADAARLAARYDYRVFGDDCGLDCQYYPTPINPPLPAGEATAESRELILSVARSLRTLAGHLESASAWLAEMGGIDVAELEGKTTDR